VQVEDSQNKKVKTVDQLALFAASGLAVWNMGPCKAQLYHDPWTRFWVLVLW